jgi:hypothetical protein
VLRSSRGGTERTSGSAPGELEFYPRDAVDAELSSTAFGIVGSVERCAERVPKILHVDITRVSMGRGRGHRPDERNALRIGPEVLSQIRRVRAHRSDKDNELTSL